jgi:hypothetical protein
VSPGRITTDPEKLKALREWPTMKKKYKIRSFLSVCMYYRWFISSFTNIVNLLTKRTEEKQALQWTPEVEAAFQTLKEALCTAPILAYLKPRRGSSTQMQVTSGLEECCRKYRMDRSE